MNYRKWILILLGILLLISFLSYMYALYIIGCNDNHNYSCNTLFFDELVSVFIATPLLFQLLYYSLPFFQNEYLKYGRNLLWLLYHLCL